MSGQKRLSPGINKDRNRKRCTDISITAVLFSAADSLWRHDVAVGFIALDLNNTIQSVVNAVTNFIIIINVSLRIIYYFISYNLIVILPITLLAWSE